MTDASILYITFPNKHEALSTIEILLKNHLVACANLLEGMQSFYRWRGDIRQEMEVVVIAKTCKACVNDAIAAITSSHPYEVPCIIELGIEGGHAPFLAWIEQETRK